MNQVFRFPGFALDTNARKVSVGENAVQLSERAFSVLLTLVETPGVVVSKRALLERGWPGLAVIEDNLVQAIREVRLALGDDPRQPRFIQTVHRRGYRFIAPLEEAGTTPPAPEPARRFPRRLVLGLGGAVAVLAVLVAVRLTERRETLPAQATHYGERFRQLFPALTCLKPAYSPDGRVLALVVPDTGTGVHSIHLADSAGGPPVQLTHGIDVRGPTPTFTHDGRSLLFTTYRHDAHREPLPEVWQVSAQGGDPALVLSGASAAQYSPDGAVLAYAAVTPNGTAIRLRGPGEAVRDLAEPGYWPRFSPDGRWVAYTSANPEGGDGHILVVGVDGSAPRQLTDRPSQVYGLSWMPDSRGIVFASDRSGVSNLWRVEIGGGPPVPITSSPASLSSPTVSPDGRSIAFTYLRGSNAAYRAPHVSAPATAVTPEQDMLDAALSPSGDRIAVALGTWTQLRGLSVLGPRAEDQRSFPLEAWRVRWTRDGERLIAVGRSPERDSRQVWQIDVATGALTALTSPDAEWDWPDVAPDGRTLATARRSESVWDLVCIDLVTRAEAVLATAPSLEGIRFSPDGRRIAWSGAMRPSDAQSGGIWVVSASGGLPQRLAPDGQFPVWEAEGSLLFARFGEVEGLWRVAAGGGSAPERVRPAERGFAVKGLDVGAKGALLLLLERGETSVYVMEADERGDR